MVNKKLFSACAKNIDLIDMMSLTKSMIRVYLSLSFLTCSAIEDVSRLDLRMKLLLIGRPFQTGILRKKGISQNKTEKSFSLIG